MLADELRQNLDKEKIKKILEDLGCHHITEHLSGKPHISGALPDGDNPTSICVYLDGYSYNTEVFTRAEFQKRKWRDIIELISFINKISFPQSVKWACDTLGFDYHRPEKRKNNELLNLLNFLEGSSKSISDDNEEEENNIPLDPEVLDIYDMTPNQKWGAEGIKLYAQHVFQIGFDYVSGRIIIPIFNNIGEIVGVKGRIWNDKDSDSKYMYLHSCLKGRILYGLSQNYDEIQKKNEVIIVESEKSVIKLYGYGYRNVIALGGKCATEHQIYEILRLGVDRVVLALDKDVGQEDIDSFNEQLNQPIKSCELLVMTDEMDFMEDEKESPCDNIDTWKILYNDYIEKYKEE